MNKSSQEFFGQQVCKRCQLHNFCEGCTKQQCHNYRTTQCENQPRTGKLTNLPIELEIRGKKHQPCSISINLPIFIPIINPADPRTHVWLAEEEVDTIIFPITSIRHYTESLPLLQQISCLKIIHILAPIADTDVIILPPLNREGEVDGVIVGGFPSYVDEPKSASWNQLHRQLQQVNRLRSQIASPIIPLLTGVHPDQQHLELKHYQQLELTHVIMAGGMYTLIKHHKRMNEIFDRVHAYQLEPILTWDLWWIPSPHLRVTHVMSGSWWQYGLHGVELAKCQRRGLPPPDPSMANSSKTSIGNNS